MDEKRIKDAIDSVAELKERLESYTDNEGNLIYDEWSDAIDSGLLPIEDLNILMAYVLGGEDLLSMFMTEDSTSFTSDN